MPLAWGLRFRVFSGFQGLMVKAVSGLGFGS